MRYRDRETDTDRQTYRLTDETEEKETQTYRPIQRDRREWSEIQRQIDFLNGGTGFFDY